MRSSRQEVGTPPPGLQRRSRDPEPPPVRGQTHLLSDLSDRLDAGSIQVVVVLSCLDEVVVLNVLLHLLPGHHKVVVSAVHLVVSFGPGGVCGGVPSLSSDGRQP